MQSTCSNISNMGLWGEKNRHGTKSLVSWKVLIKTTATINNFKQHWYKWLVYILLWLSKSGCLTPITEHHLEYTSLHAVGGISLARESHDKISTNGIKTQNEGITSIAPKELQRLGESVQRRVYDIQHVNDGFSFNSSPVHIIMSSDRIHEYGSCVGISMLIQ